jgi:hypothetical protein
MGYTWRLENILRLESGCLENIWEGRCNHLSDVVCRLVELDVEIEWDEILQDYPGK